MLIILAVFWISQYENYSDNIEKDNIDSQLKVLYIIK